MRLMRIFHVELYKLIKSKIWPIFLLGPLFGSFILYYYSLLGDNNTGWINAYSRMIGIYGLYLLPLLTGLIVAMICRYEHANGGWKQYLSQPVKRWQVYAIKYILASGSIAIIQFLMFIALIGVGTLIGIEGSVPLRPILTSLFGGWLATFPLVALQLWVTTSWSSFAAPMALNVVLTLPSLLVAGHETLGLYYPWAQPLLAMAFPSEGMETFSHIPLEIFLFVVICGFIIFFFGGMGLFQRRSY